jgi:hypothetical protein
MRLSAAMLFAAALGVAACDRSPPSTDKAQAKPRTPAEIDAAVAQLEAQHKRLEVSVQKLEQGAARWVLWQSAQPVNSGPAYLPLSQPVDAFPDREPCVAAAKQAVSGAQRALNRTGELSYQGVGADGNLMQITYACLPETIDPRRPAPAR